MLRSKNSDTSASYACSWNTSQYLQSDKYTFTVSYSGKTASVDKYIINVGDWQVTEYVDREVTKEVEQIKYIERYNTVTEYVNQTQYVHVETLDKSEMLIFFVGGIVFYLVVLFIYGEIKK